MKDGTQYMRSLRVALVNADGVPESRQQARPQPPSGPGPGTIRVQRPPLWTASACRLLECGLSSPASFPTLGSVELPKADAPQGLIFVINSQHTIPFQ